MRGRERGSALQLIRGLYAVTPDGWPQARLLAAVEQALAAGVRLLQYRAKAAAAPTAHALPTAPAACHAQAMAIRALCDRYHAMLIVNDDPRLAAAVDADGVHLGRDDGSVAAARAVLGPAPLIGVSCYDQFELARRAYADGADYVAFGSMFASAVKPGAVRAPLALLERARAELPLPVVAIGGIDLDNVRSVFDAGAHAAAVISAVFAAPDVATAVRGFDATLAEAGSARAMSG
jgi:thiamine-phosphate pyrophosphorylase